MSIPTVLTPPPPGGEAVRPPTELPWLPWGLASALCLVYLGSEIFVFGRLAFPLDDSWIHLQFARQLAAGQGLTYNGDHWLPGSTAPLWTALLSLGFLLPLGTLVWPKLLGLAAFLGSLLATDRLAAELYLGRSLRLVATLSVASCQWLLWSSLSGMEICLFLCVSTWGLVWHVRERRRPERAPAVSLFLLAVACLLRPEGMLLLLLACCDRAFQWRRQDGPAGPLTLRWAADGGNLVHGLSLAAILLLPNMAFNFLSSGSPFATTLAVKGGGGGVVPDGAHLRKVLTILFTSQPMLLLFVGAGCLVLVKRLGSDRDSGLLPALWLLALPIANAVLSPSALGNFGRYYFPLLPLVAILGALGLRPLWSLGHSLSINLRGNSLRLPLRAILILLFVTPQIWSALSGVPRYLQTLSNVEDSDVAAAHWLAPRLPEEAVLAVQDIGALKFLLPNRVIDLAGIVTPEVQPILAAGRGQGENYWEKRLYDYLAGQRPDYLVVFPKTYPMLTGGIAGFEEVKRFEVEQNVTMAGPRLAIYSTPWTRHTLRRIGDSPP